MCHLYSEPDTLIRRVQEKIAADVVKVVMADHRADKETPRPLRVTPLGLVFHVLSLVDIDAGSIAGKTIIRELTALGFIQIRFRKTDDNCTNVEFTLASLANFEEHSYKSEGATNGV